MFAYSASFLTYCWGIRLLNLLIKRHNAARAGLLHLVGNCVHSLGPNRSLHCHHPTCLGGRPLTSVTYNPRLSVLSGHLRHSSCFSLNYRLPLGFFP